jgi:hypothetical protein
VDNLGAAFTFGFRLTANGANHLLRQVYLLHFHH